MTRQMCTGFHLKGDPADGSCGRGKRTHAHMYEYMYVPHMFNRSMKEKSPFPKNIKRVTKFRLGVFLPAENPSQITMHSVGLENSKIKKHKKGSRNSGWVPFVWFQYCMQQPMQRTLQTNHDPPAVKISLFFSEIAYSKQSITKECEHTDEWPMCTGVPWAD